jgi:outer membrane lipase/esterase
MSLRFAMRLGAIVFASALTCSAAHATVPYDAIIVFGDSYNDVGNIHAIAAQNGVNYPPPPYYKGRFSNGPIWLEHVAGAWNLPLAPSILGGSDWAEGGAQLLQTVTLDGLPIPSVEDQVLEYLHSTGGKADPHALYVVEGGGNDILGATSFDPTLGAKIATGLNGIVQTLAAAGARSFLLPDLIDVGQLPAAQAGGPAFVKYASATAAEVNQRLLGSPSLYGFGFFLFGVQVYRVPTFQTFHDIAHASTHYGFANVTTPCLGPTLGVCADPDHTLWWDAEHPSAFGHTVFAILVEGRVGGN